MIQRSLSLGEISAGHAKVLLSVTEESERIRFHQEVVGQKLSVRALEDRVHPPAPPETTEVSTESPIEPVVITPPTTAVVTPPSVGPTPSSSPPEPIVDKSPHIEEQEDLLSQILGTKVLLNENHGKGKIIIEFYSPKDYERLRELFSAGAKPSTLQG